MKKLFKSLAATAILLLAFTHTSHAQTEPDSGGPTPGPVAPPPTGVPIDGGASLLLAGGAAYGLRKLRRPRA